MLDKARGWLKYRWWGIFVTYQLLLIMFYCAVWVTIEPINLPDNWDLLPSFFRSRLFFHIIVTVLLASHTTLFLEAFRRRKEWHAERTELVANPTRQIRYGDKIRLIHLSTGQALHSHVLNNSHPGSSNQQQVTAFDGRDSNDFWIVKPRHGIGLRSKLGHPIWGNDILRLEHVNTGRNLHSHSGVPSPLSGQQEITAFGRDGNGDTNDNWQIIVLNDGLWLENERFRLLHINTKVTLHSHAGHNDPQFTAAQQEVTGYTGRDENDFWMAEHIEDTRKPEAGTKFVQI